MNYFLAQASFPFGEKNQVKSRPVVVLTKPNGKYNSVICAYVTSQIEKDLSELDIILEPTNSNGLTKLSKIKLYKITSLEASSFGEVIGKLDDTINKLIKEKLKKMLNL